MTKESPVDLLLGATFFLAAAADTNYPPGLLDRGVKRKLRLATTASATRTNITPYFNSHIFMISERNNNCLLYTSPSPRDRQKSRMPSSA